MSQIAKKRLDGLRKEGRSTNLSIWGRRGSNFVERRTDISSFFLFLT